jgi:hypothetical protein
MTLQCHSTVWLCCNYHSSTERNQWLNQSINLTVLKYHSAVWLCCDLDPSTQRNQWCQWYPERYQSLTVLQCHSTVCHWLCCNYHSSTQRNQWYVIDIQKEIQKEINDWLCYNAIVLCGLLQLSLFHTKKSMICHWYPVVHSKKSMAECATMP